MNRTKPVPHELTFFVFPSPMTGIHLTAAARERLKRRAERTGKPIMQVFREAAERGLRGRA